MERFFRNLILGETNELQSRYLLVGLRPDEKTLFDQGGPEMRSEKSGQKTVDRLWLRLKEHPHLSQAGLVAALGITRSTIQKHIANLKAADRLRRIGPDKGGHWEVVETRASHAGDGKGRAPMVEWEKGPKPKSAPGVGHARYGVGCHISRYVAAVSLKTAAAESWQSVYDTVCLFCGIRVCDIMAA